MYKKREILVFRIVKLLGFVIREIENLHWKWSTAQLIAINVNSLNNLRFVLYIEI